MSKWARQTPSRGDPSVNYERNHYWAWQTAMAGTRKVGACSWIALIALGKGLRLRAIHAQKVLLKKGWWQLLRMTATILVIPARHYIL